MISFLLTFALCAITQTHAFSIFGYETSSTPKVQYSRQFALQCCEYYLDGIVDGRQDGKGTRAEISKMIEIISGKFEFVVSFFGYDADRIMKDCDGNRDGVLTHDDWPISVSPNCMDDTSSVQNAVYFVCKHMAKRGDKFYDLVHPELAVTPEQQQALRTKSQEIKNEINID